MLDEPTVAMDVEAPARVLDDDARVRRRRQDGRVRDALPRGGRRLRRPDRADGPRPDRRRRAADRDQGDGRLAHDPRDAARRRPRRARSAARRDARPSAAARRSCCAARTPTRRSGRCSPSSRTRATSRSAAPAWRRRSSQLTGDEAEARDERSRPTRATSCCARSATAASSIFSLGSRSSSTTWSPAPNRNDTDFGGTRLSAPLYYMVGLAAFGTMTPMLSSGARIAAERAVGWNRQLRLTPLTPRDVLPRQGAHRLRDGARQHRCCCTPPGRRSACASRPTDWVEMTALILVGLIPFAALGILLGHLVTSTRSGPAIGGMTALFALLGGTWFPISSTRRAARHRAALPSYWLVQASHIAVGGSAWGARAGSSMGCLDRRARRPRRPRLPARHEAT